MLPALPAPPALSAAASASAGPDPAAYLAVVLLVAVLCQWLAWALRVPSLLLLLIAGFALGHWQRPDEIFGPDPLFAAVTVAVGIILFEGSLSLRFSDLRGISTPVRRLCTTVALLAWILITGAALLIGLDPALAVLVGAILIVTGPTVINPILRQLRPTRRVSSMLRWEGIVVDPIGAILAVLVYQVIVAFGSEGTVALVVGNLATTLAISFGIAGVVGFSLGYLVRRHLVPDFLQAVLFLGVAIAVVVISNRLAAESGLLTVTVLGIVLANQPGLQLQQIREFKEHLQVLLVGVLFIVLAGRITTGDIVDVLPRAALFLALLILLARPVSTFLGLANTSATRRERLLLAFMAPRGIVAAAVTSVFALKFDAASTRVRETAPGLDDGSAEEVLAHADALARLAEQAEALVPLVFLVIVGTVTIYGLGVGRLAERLGLATSRPQGILFAGASPWTISAATLLTELDIPTLIVDPDFRRLQRARMAGLTTVRTNIVSEFAVDRLELAGLGSFIGATNDDSANATAAREFAHIFGKNNSFQLTPADAAGDAKPTKAPPERLLGRRVFDPAPTLDELEQRTAGGHVVKKTKLTDDFTLEDFRARYPEAIIMFVIKAGRLSVVTASTTLPTTGVALIAMVPGKQATPRTEAAPARAESRDGART
ncbi:MAG TPA: sodium:proton antiporter [Intrasporangiaceae bacterium]|nr:sodium:proton antiporter [Intrasporangiaceae bacterium]